MGNRCGNISLLFCPDREDLSVRKQVISFFIRRYFLLRLAVYDRHSGIGNFFPGVGIQNPEDTSGFLQKVALKKGSVVTSGDYQRLYVVDGKPYHHIIDPETLYPGEKWRAVTVVVGDSGLADALSTTLFLMDREEGQALLERFGAEAAWTGPDGKTVMSPGYAERIIP